MVEMEFKTDRPAASAACRLISRSDDIAKHPYRTKRANSDFQERRNLFSRCFVDQKHSRTGYALSRRHPLVGRKSLESWAKIIELSTAAQLLPEKGEFGRSYNRRFTEYWWVSPIVGFGAAVDLKPF